jgi:hypothetical protein
MTECFTVENILLSDVFQDVSTSKFIRKVNYKDNENKLLVETPVLIIDSIMLQKYDQFKKICIKCHMEVQNDAFIETLTNIDDCCLQKMKDGKECYINTYNNDTKQFTFYIPIYNDKINVLIEDKQKNVVSIKNLIKGLGIKVILLLSHLDIGNKVVFLNWNMTQIKIENHD